jgi:hypothetical protein
MFVVWGLGFMVWGLGFGVCCLLFIVWFRAKLAKEQGRKENKKLKIRK